MSIRISGQTDMSAVENTRPASPKTIEPDAHSTGYQSVGQTGTDRADLSSASGLVLLTKQLTPQSKAEKLSALTARVAAGQYRPSASEVSRSIVQGLIRR